MADIKKILLEPVTETLVDTCFCELFLKKEKACEGQPYCKSRSCLVNYAPRGFKRSNLEKIYRNRSLDGAEKWEIEEQNK